MTVPANGDGDIEPRQRLVADLAVREDLGEVEVRHLSYCCERGLNGSRASLVAGQFRVVISERLVEIALELGDEFFHFRLGFFVLFAFERGGHTDGGDVEHVAESLGEALRKLCGLGVLCEQMTRVDEFLGRVRRDVEHDAPDRLLRTLAYAEYTSVAASRARCRGADRTEYGRA